MRWEYNVWDLDTDGGIASIYDDVNRRASEGWELVSAAPLEHNYPRLIGIFKREAQDAGDDPRDPYAPPRRLGVE